MSDGKILLTSTVTELPQWIVLFREDAAVSSFPISGPQGPPCASG